MKLLIVDDNPEMRRLLRRVIGGLASEITECDDGGGVLAAYHRAQPDWVLMDIGLKAVDGLTATRQLLIHWPHAQVLIVTNYNDDVLREAARAAGAVGYVLKEDLSVLRGLLAAAPDPVGRQA